MSAAPTRLSQVRKAVRPALKGRLMMSGPPGAGKTRTGLIVATELAEGGPILVIDTERESALTYADDFDFEHLPWHPPFDPAELTQVVKAASGTYAVTFIDSFSHFWRGEGGVLDVAGGKFTGWKEARPLHEALLQSLLACDSHVILGVRSKVDYVQETENGRQVVRKLGMADQQDDNLSFEMNVALDLAMDHTATVSKSRTTALPVGRQYGVDKTAEMACTYRDWLKGGEEPVGLAVAQTVLDRLNALEGEQYRRRCKAQFAGAFGRPEQLRDSVLDAALAMLADFETGSGHPDGTDDGGPGRTAGEREGVAGPGDLPVTAATAPGPATSPDRPAGTAGMPGTVSPPADTAPSSQEGGAPDGHISAADARKLHRQLGAILKGEPQATHEAFILVASNGRTAHAAELSEAEAASAYLFAKDVEEGRVALGDVLEAAAEAERAGRAVADFDRQVGPSELEASLKRAAT